MGDAIGRVPPGVGQGSGRAEGLAEGVDRRDVEAAGSGEVVDDRSVLRSELGQHLGPGGEEREVGIGDADHAQQQGRDDDRSVLDRRRRGRAAGGWTGRPRGSRPRPADRRRPPPPREAPSAPPGRASSVGPSTPPRRRRSQTVPSRRPSEHLEPGRVEIVDRVAGVEATPAGRLVRAGGTTTEVDRVTGPAQPDQPLGPPPRSDRRGRSRARRPGSPPAGPGSARRRGPSTGTITVPASSGSALTNTVGSSPPRQVARSSGPTHSTRRLVITAAPYRTGCAAEPRENRPEATTWGRGLRSDAGAARAASTT